MAKEKWNGAHFSCNTRKVFGANGLRRVLFMCEEELDLFCEQAEVVWQKTEDGGIHVHGCGMSCYCHGGRDNPKLRPR